MTRTKKYYPGKVAIVTGSTRGLGFELVRQLLSLGSRVVITGRDADRLAFLRTEFSTSNDSVAFFQADFTRPGDVEALMRFTIETYGRIDLLINNAGLSAFGTIEQTDYASVGRVFGSNFYSAFFMTHAAIPFLRQTKGRIFLISSLAGLRGIPGYSLYSASKAAMKSLYECARIECRRDDIFVGIAFPGFVENEQGKQGLNADGNMEVLPKRNKKITQSRSYVASRILRQIAHKKNYAVYSGIGKLLAFMSRWLPGLLRNILLNRYNKQN